MLHGVHLRVLCRRHGGDVADVCGSVDAIQATLEGLILRGTIKAKIDATTSTRTFVQGDERHVAYAAAVGAAESAVALSQEIVLRSNALLAGDAVAEPRGF